MAERAAFEQALWRTLLALGAVWLVYQCLTVLVIALVAIVLASALMPLADALERRRIPRFVTVAAVYVAGFGLALVVTALLVPVVIEQGRLLLARVPAMRDSIAGWIEALRGAAAWRWRGAEYLRIPEVGPEQIQALAGNLARGSLAFTRDVITGALSAFLMLFISGYAVVDNRRLADSLLVFVPPARRREVARVAGLVFERMGGYVRGQIAVSLCIGTLLAIGLAIVGVEAPLLIGATAGALNLVPYLGSTLALLLALLIAVNQSLLAIVGVLVVFGVVQFLEGYAISPYFLGRTADLHPLLVLAALLIGGSLAGLIGVVLAVPIGAGLKVLAQQTWARNPSGS
jgi:predicted PurR-regulated permease PerM